MTLNDLITQHYIENKTKLMKRLTYSVGTEWAAEDVLHNAYERAMKYYKSFDGTDFNRWFSLIVRNAARDYLKEERGIPTVELDEFDHEGDVCSGYYDKVYAEIDKLIKSKPPVHEEILRLHFQLEYSAIDISRVTDNTYSNSHQVIRRFKEELKERYK